MSLCPYCGSEHFKAEATEVEAGKWRNQCEECDLYSDYTETTEIQAPLDEPERTTG